jgi:hypothetical protein
MRAVRPKKGIRPRRIEAVLAVKKRPYRSHAPDEKERTVPLVGHVYYITDASNAFVPVVLGDKPPTIGFVPWPGAKVQVTYYREFLGLRLWLWRTTATAGSDGSFQLADPPAQVEEMASFVSLLVSSGVSVFRSAYVPIAEARSHELDMWVYVDRLPVSDGISAGTISQLVSGHGLPGNTTITAGGPYGLNFSGSEGQVNMNFNIWIAPDTSPNLDDFLDLSINGYDINVGWPTDWVESPDDVLNSIKSGIAAAGGSINAAVLNRMAEILETQDGLSSPVAREFLNNDVSVVFFGIGYPHKHSWKISNTTDETVVLTANPCIGFPRNFAAESSA